MNKKTDIRKLVIISMLGAIAFILMLLEFPLWFVPAFYELDLSEVAVLIGGFSFGPVAAVMIEGIKVILNLIFTGSITMGVGELANFLIGLSFVVPASYMYKKHKTRKHAIIGLVVGTVSMATLGAILNAYLLLPAYAYFMSTPDMIYTVESFVYLGTQVNPLVTNLFTFLLFAVVPFNLIKGILTSAVVILIYKRVSVLIKAKDMAE
ncbi:ECF transporter S component [Mycoplasmatota bacterium]|nr:ECF transporter S component [Mycoplasmatota bacterium]